MAVLSRVNSNLSSSNNNIVLVRCCVRLLRWTLRGVPMLFLGVVLIQRVLSLWLGQYRPFVLPATTFVERTCPRPNYPTLTDPWVPDPRILATNTNVSNNNKNNNNPTTSNNHNGGDRKDPKICITTLTDERNRRHGDGADASTATSTTSASSLYSWISHLVRWRNFDGVLDLTWDNKVSYANRHGYFWFDESQKSLDPRRPPSWSKIQAVLRVMREEACEWVVWLDADTVVMNSNKRIMDFLPQHADLILSHDDGGGYNAGAWVAKNTPWTVQFLETWWAMKTFVRPPGLSTSGDNHALKSKLANMSQPEFDQHIVVPPRCTFNSFAWFVSPNHPAKRAQDLPWYKSDAYFHKSDWIAHVAGVDNKAMGTQLLLNAAA